MSKRRFIEKLSTWRKVALSAWGPPRDPTAYGTLDLDCEEALAYLAGLKADTDESITLTHLTGKAIAIAIAANPEVNAFVARGKLALRESVDIFFQVAFFDEHEDKQSALKTARKDANLAGAKVSAADEKSVVEIAQELRARATAIRKKSDAETAKAAKAMASLPGPLVGLATRAGAYLSYDYNMNLSRLGIPYDAFGSAMVTNVGSFGIPVGYAPLLELSRVPLVLTLGAVRDAPSVHKGALCIRKRVTIGVAFDHRVMDGYHAGVMAKTFMRIMEDPASQLSLPPRSLRPTSSTP